MAETTRNINSNTDDTTHPGVWLRQLTYPDKSLFLTGEEKKCIKKCHLMHSVVVESGRKVFFVWGIAIIFPYRQHTSL